jgi:hypothetical protein
MPKGESIMSQRIAFTAVALGASLVFLAGCASVDDLKRLEQRVASAEAKAEQAHAAAQASRSEATKAIETADLAMKSASEAKAAVEQAKKNPYLP